MENYKNPKFSCDQRVDTAKRPSFRMRLIFVNCIFSWFINTNFWKLGPAINQHNYDLKDDLKVLSLNITTHNTNSSPSAPAHIFVRGDDEKPMVKTTVKSQIFVRYLSSYFRTFEKSTKFNCVWTFLFVLRPSDFNVIFFWGPQKYEN